MIRILDVTNMRIKVKGEQETTITRTQICINGKNIDCWMAYSSVPSDIRRFKNMEWELVHENADGSCTFRSTEETSVKISFGYKRERKPISDEQKERLKQWNFGRKDN